MCQNDDVLHIIDEVSIYYFICQQKIYALTGTDPELLVTGVLESLQKKIKGLKLSTSVLHAL